MSQYVGRHQLHDFLLGGAATYGAAYRNGNYSAFYVEEPFSEANLGAHATRDFVYYNLHDKNYNVRDGSDWERTLKPRIRERLSKSTNMILFLSSITKNSRALREEVDYGINSKELPVIVVYPDFSKESDIIGCESKTIRKQIKDLWDKLPKFRDSMTDVPTLHVPNKKSLIKEALLNKNFRVQTKGKSGVSFYPC